jgi:hypothetical protein
MADDFQASDILGSTSPVGPGRRPQGALSSSNAAALGICGFLLIFALLKSRSFLARWRERSHRL